MMERQRPPRLPFKERLKEGVKQVGHRVWQLVRHQWHRFQLTRWLIIIVLSLFLVTVSYTHLPSST